MTMENQQEITAIQANGVIRPFYLFDMAFDGNYEVNPFRPDHPSTYPSPDFHPDFLSGQLRRDDRRFFRNVSDGDFADTFFGFEPIFADYRFEEQQVSGSECGFFIANQCMSSVNNSLMGRYADFRGVIEQPALKTVAAVPLPFGGILLGTALAGFGAVSRRRPRKAA